MKVIHSSSGRSPQTVVKKIRDTGNFIKGQGRATLLYFVAKTPNGSVAPAGLLKLSVYNSTQDSTANPDNPFYGIGRFGTESPGSLGDPDKGAPKGTITEFMKWWRSQQLDQAQTRAYNKQARRALRARKKAQQGGSSIP